MNGIEQLSIEDLERIDRTCCQFEKELKRGNGIDLREYLKGSTGHERSTLLYELVALDIDYRKRRGEEPPQGDYEAMFPDDCGVIERAFARNRPKLRSDTAETADVATHVAKGQRGDQPEAPASI